MYIQMSIALNIWKVAPSFRCLHRILTLDATDPALSALDVDGLVPTSHAARLVRVLHLPATLESDPALRPTSVEFSLDPLQLPPPSLFRTRSFRR